MTYLYFALAAIIAGLVQGTTGFGAGVVVMLVLPYLMPLPEAAGISGAMALGLCSLMTYRYRGYIRWNHVWIPSGAYVLAGIAAIYLAPGIDTVALKIVFAIFLIFLSSYFLLKKDGMTLKPTISTKLLVGTFSGLSDGFFGIGGPLMVVLYLSFSESRKEYMGTLQISFVIGRLLNFIFRLQQGVIEVRHVPYICFGIIMTALGLWLAHFVNQRVNVQIVRQATYLLIGISGLIALVTTLF